MSKRPTTTNASGVFEPFHVDQVPTEDEEEHVFVLEGGLTLQLGSKTYQLSAGHYVCFPAGQKVGHSLTNRTEKPCRYLVFGNPQPNDVAVFPETDRVSVRLTGESYRKSPTIEYWEGVEVERKP